MRTARALSARALSARALSLRAAPASTFAALMALTFPAAAGTGTDGMGGPGNSAEPGSSGTSSGNYNGSGGGQQTPQDNDMSTSIITGKNEKGTAGPPHTGGRNA